MIRASRRRMLVGLRRSDWTEVWFAPIIDEASLEDVNYVPEIALHSKPHGEPAPGDPMLGEVAWESLFDPRYFGSSRPKEKELMQRKILWLAWSYLMAENADDIESIRLELVQSKDPRRKALERECRQERKRRSRNATRRKQARTARGLVDKPTDSDNSSDESGYDSDHGRGPPNGSGPNRPDCPGTDVRPPMRPGPSGPEDGYTERPSSERSNLFMSGGLGSRSGPQSVDMDGSIFGRATPNTQAGGKRRYLDTLESPNKLLRTNGSGSGVRGLGGVLMLNTQTATGQQPEGEADEGFDDEDVRSMNGGLGENAALETALHLPNCSGQKLRDGDHQLLEEDDIQIINNGFDEATALAEALRNSQVPEDRLHTPKSEQD